MTSDEIAERLATFPLFREFSPAEIGQLAGVVQEETYAAGEVIFRQGDPSPALYFVDTGSVEQVGLDANGREIIRRAASPGESFGRTAILMSTAQPTMSTASADAHLFVLSPQVVSWLLSRRPALRHELIPVAIAGRLRALPCFASLSDSAILRLADLVHPVVVPAKEPIGGPQELAETLYLIDTGQVETETIDAEGRRREFLTAGGFLGGNAALGSALRQRARARSEVSLLALTDTDLRWLLRTYPALRNDLHPPDIVGRLRAVSLFSALPDSQLRILAGYTAWHHYPAGRTVISQGDVETSVHILDTGEAVAQLVDENGRDHPYAHFHPGEYLGDAALFLADARDASIQATGPTNWLVLHRDDFALFEADYPDIHPRLRIRREIQERLRYRHFQWQEPGEVILFWARRHWIVLLQRCALPVGILWGLVLILALALGWRLPPWLSEILITAVGFTVLTIAWVLVDWNNDYLAVSNRRITHLERVLLVSETRREAPLDKVQDLNIVRRFWGNLFGYGNLMVQTAATVGKIIFDHLAEPERAHEIIFAQVARARASAHAASRGAVRRGLERNLVPWLEMRVPARALPGVSPAPREPQRKRPHFWPRLSWAEGERVTWRKHWINLIQRTIRPLLLMVISLVGLILAADGWGPFVADQIRSPLFLLLLLIFLGCLGWLIWNYVDWGNDLYIVTGERIMDYQKKPLAVSESRREASLAVVQNVTLNVPGPVAYLLNYGHVVIQTAAETGQFNFRYISNPREVQNEIFRHIENYRLREAARQAEQRRAELTDWFTEYDRLHSDRRALS